MIKILMRILMTLKRKKRKTKRTTFSRNPLRNSTSRRIRRYGVTPEALLHMFTTGMVSGVEEGILPGATFRGFTLDPYHNVIFIFVEHPLFESVPYGTGNAPEDRQVVLKDMRQTLKDLMPEKEENE